MNEDVRLDDLATLYVGLAHGVDGRMHFNEFTQIANHLQQWQHPGDRRDVLTLVDEAVSQHSPEAVQEAVARLALTTSDREKQAIMEDLSQIALADRRFLQQEAEYIGAVADAWGVHVASDQRGAFWSVLRARTLAKARTAAHDLALLYVAVAVRPDGDASEAELATVSKALAGWLPQSLPQQIEDIVRQVLAAYARGFSESDLRILVDRVRAAVPEHQWPVLARDLRTIARADGSMSVEERTLIERIEAQLSSQG